MGNKSSEPKPEFESKLLSVQYSEYGTSSSREHKINLNGTKPIRVIELETPLTDTGFFELKDISIPRVHCQLTENNNQLWIETKDHEGNLTIATVDQGLTSLPKLVEQIRKWFNYINKTLKQGLKISVSTTDYRCTITSTTGQPFRIFNSESKKPVPNSITGLLGLDVAIKNSRGAFVTEYVGTQPVVCVRPTDVQIYLSLGDFSCAIVTKTSSRPGVTNGENSKVRISLPKDPVKQVHAELRYANKSVYELYETFGAPWNFTISAYIE